MVPEASGDGEEDDAAAAPASLAARSGGVSAKFKISNASKVPCSVDFTLTPKVDGGATDETFPMEVHPSRLDVPPHEHRYVTTYFAPVAIGTFAATFEANVVDGGDPKTKQFTCGITGEGTLPHVSIETPAELNEEGAPVIRFPRAMIRRRATRQIVLERRRTSRRVSRGHAEERRLHAGGRRRHHRTRAGAHANATRVVRAAVGG